MGGEALPAAARTGGGRRCRQEVSRGSQILATPETAATRLFKSSDVEFNRLSTSAYAKLNLVDVLI
jgi:hypothetical protein